MSRNILEVDLILEIHKSIQRLNIETQRIPTIIVPYLNYNSQLLITNRSVVLECLC